MLKFKNEIVRHKSGFRAFAFDSHAAEVLNKRFKTYAGEPCFVAIGAEGVFDFPASELAFVRAVLAKFGGIESGSL